MRAEAGDSVCFSPSLSQLLVEIKVSLEAQAVSMEDQANVAEKVVEWTKKERYR